MSTSRNNVLPSDTVEYAAQRPQIIACQSEPAGAWCVELMGGALAVHGNSDADASGAGDGFGFAAVHVAREAALSGARILMDEAVHDEAVSILKEYDAARSQGILLNGDNGYGFPGADGGMHAVTVNHGGYSFALLQECRDDVTAFQHETRVGFALWCSHVALAA
jgi:hypothetical protein